jgi:hypothetical protein
MKKNTHGRNGSKTQYQYRGKRKIRCQEKQLVNLTLHCKRRLMISKSYSDKKENKTNNGPQNTEGSWCARI